MSRAVTRRIEAVRQALLSGNAEQALARLDDLTATLARGKIDEAARESLEPALADLRQLAEASLQGARGAAEEVRAIVLAAQSLATYDSFGRRQLKSVTAPAPRRF
jgi:hypothetical protein